MPAPPPLTVPDVALLSHPATLGATDDTYLTITPVADVAPTVSESDAKRIITTGSPLAYAAGPFVLFALAHVTEHGGGLLTVDTAPPLLDGRTFWVAAWEYNLENSFAMQWGCLGPNSNGEPVASTTAGPSLPPLEPHYYFAVLGDAQNGQAVTWQQDQSGYNLRNC
jgi:hypothetical protein